MSPERQESFAEERGKLKGEFAKLLSCSSNKLTRSKELVRIWRDVPQPEYEPCIRFLDRFTDAKNPEEKLWVDDPEADHQPHKGRWRLVRNEYDMERPRQTGIIQTLREGFAAELLWDEAVLLDGRDVIGDSAAKDDGLPERYKVAEFRNLDPAYLGTMLDNIISTENVDNPTIGSVSLTGTWYFIGTRHRMAEDGSQSLRLVLAQSRAFLETWDGHGTPVSTQVLYLWNIPREIAQTIVDAADTGAHRRGAMGNYDTEQGTVDVTVRKVTTTESTSHEYVRTAARSTDLTRKIYSTELGAPTQANGVLKRRRSRTDEFGKFTTEQEVETPTNQTSTDYEETAEHSVTASRATQATSALSAPSQQAGKIKRRTNRPTEAGRTQTINETVTENAQSASSYQKSAKHTVAITRKRHDSAVGSPTQADGTVKTVDNYYESGGKYTSVNRTVTAVAGSATFTFALNADYSETHTVKWNQTSISLGSPASGKERTIQFSVNEDGKFNWYIITRDRDIGQGYGSSNAQTHYVSHTAAFRTTWTGSPSDPPWEEHQWVSYQSVKVVRTQYKTEAAAYASISSESIIYLQGTGVTTRGKDRYIAQKVTDNGWGDWTEIT